MLKTSISVFTRFFSPSSKYSWLSLRDLLWRDSLKAAGAVFPFLGTYIVVLDGMVFAKPRWEMYFGYSGALVFFVCFYSFGVLCPFIYKDYSSLKDFLHRYEESDDNATRLYLATSVVRQDGQDWKRYLALAWEAPNVSGVWLVITMKIVLSFAAALVFVAGLMSVIRVYGTLFS